MLQNENHPELHRPREADVIVVPKDAVVTWCMAMVPLETPIGIMDGYAMEISFAGNRYQVVELGMEPLVLDMESGALDRLRLEE